jgi:ATP-dependent DNA helicase PIF1
VPLGDDSSSSLTMQSPQAQVLREASLIVIDEATMGSKELYELIDVLLRDVMRTDNPDLADVPFGGKVVVLSGDLRQLAPVIKKASRTHVVSKVLQRSQLWPHFRLLKLTTNMRVQRLAHNPEAADRLRVFAAWLLDIGDGLQQHIPVPPHMHVNLDNPMQLILNVFPGLGTTTFVAMDACILSTHNKFVDDLNSMVLGELDGEGFSYLSADGFQPGDEDKETMFPVEILNSLTPTGLPPHKLLLKRGAPVVFIRNLSMKLGVMNGTRGVVLQCKRNLLQVQLSSGTCEGNTFLVPRINLDSKDDIDGSLSFRRRQYPLRLAFCMTISKAQGQTFRVGIFLRLHFFGRDGFGEGKKSLVLSGGALLAYRGVCARTAVRGMQPRRR